MLSSSGKAGEGSMAGGAGGAIEEWTEVEFGNCGRTRTGGQEDGSSLWAGREGRYKIVGGVRERMWTTYLALPLPNLSSSSNSSSSSLSSLPFTDPNQSSPTIYHPNTSFSSGGLSLLPETLALTILDFPTPYYLAPLGSSKLVALFNTLKTQILPLPRSTSVVPVFAIKLVEGNFGKNGRRAKRLCLLTGRVGRGERLRSVLRVCGRLELGVAKDHLVQVLAGLEVLKKEGVTHEGTLDFFRGAYPSDVQS
jgi:hypothetical protein